VPAALDAVVARAMAKRPGDRFPSAGDLGRAAQAAQSGAEVTVPERTVATGAAATVEAETVPAAERDAEPTEPAEPAARAAETRRIEREVAAERRASGSRRALIAGGAAALAAAVAVAVVLASGSGSGGGGEAATGQTAATTATTTGQPDAQRSLSRSELIAKGDEICEESRDRFVAVRNEFPTGVKKEEEPDAVYSRKLVDISSNAVERFEALDPPAVLAADYDAYVASQRQVRNLDEDALQAAQSGDVAAYLAAREGRDATEDDRQELAEAIGFHVCSGSEA
jgi:hypothetical protein